MQPEIILPVTMIPDVVCNFFFHFQSYSNYSWFLVISYELQMSTNKVEHASDWNSQDDIITTIGFLKEAHDVNIHGFNVYHKNRLILVSCKPPLRRFFTCVCSKTMCKSVNVIMFQDIWLKWLKWLVILETVYLGTHATHKKQHMWRPVYSDIWNILLQLKIAQQKLSQLF